MEIIHTPITDFLIRKSRIFGGFLARNIQEFGGFLIRIITDILIRNIPELGGFLIRIMTDILIRNIEHSNKKYSIKNIGNIGGFWRNDSDKDTLAYYDSTDKDTLAYQYSTDTFNSCDACEYLVQNIDVTIAFRIWMLLLHETILIKILLLVMTVQILLIHVMHVSI